MTLVVADIWPSGRVRVVADLRVTDAHELRRGYPSAVLKNVILGPQMVVAFAGNVALATHTLRSLPSRPGEADAVLSALLEASKLGGSGKSGVDFIVAVGDQGLWCVTNKGVESDQTSAWLGDVQAFDLYQQAYHGTSVAEPIRVPGISPAGAIPIDAQELEGLIRMSNALTSLQFDRSVESVGEAFVTATSSKDGFRYEAQVYLAADHEQVITGAQWVPADWGTVATGGFGYCVLVPTGSGTGVIGLHFPHAGLGLLYHPLAQDEAFSYNRVAHGEFRDAVLRDHGISIDGPQVVGGSS